MFKLFIQQCGQKYPSPWQKSNSCLYRKIFMQVRAFERYIPIIRFQPCSKIFYWPFQGGTSFVIFFMFLFCLVFAMSLCASVYMCFLVISWEKADLLALLCGVQLWVCHFPIGILGQVWYLIVSIPDLCTHTYFVKSDCPVQIFRKMMKYLKRYCRLLFS